MGRRDVRRPMSWFDCSSIISGFTTTRALDDSHEVRRSTSAVRYDASFNSSG